MHELPSGTADAYVGHRYQGAPGLYRWAIGLNGVGLLACFLFVISEYQVLFNDCLSKYAASTSISFATKVSLTFLVGAGVSVVGIAVHLRLLRRFRPKGRQEARDLRAPSKQAADRTRTDRFRKLTAYHEYAGLLSVAIFIVGLTLCYVAAFSINAGSVDSTIAMARTECPRKVLSQ